MKTSEPFAKLFRKYRLRAEFETLQEFGSALAEYNLIFEYSIFSHWQKGSRVPKDRRLLLTILEIFVKRHSITTLEQANEFMSSTGLGYITISEQKRLSLANEKSHIESKLIEATSYIKAQAVYFIHYLETYKNSSSFFSKVEPETDTILWVIETSIKAGLLSDACALWKLFGGYYWHIAEWKDFRKMSMSLYQIAKQIGDIQLQLSICLEEVSRLYYYDGNIHEALKKSEEALDLAKSYKDIYWQAVAHQRFGKLCFMIDEIDKGIHHLEIAGTKFRQLNKVEYLSHNARYLSEGYTLKKDYERAHTLLQTALQFMQEAASELDSSIYEPVIYAQLGMLSYIRNNFSDAKNYFLTGLAKNRNQPYTKGTNSWLNKMGLAVTYLKLNAFEDAKKMKELAIDEMKQLGIEKSFPKINVYAAALAPEVASVRYN